MTTGLVLAAAAAASALAGFADLEAIDRQVAGFTGAPIGAVGGAMTGVDRRLRLQPCRSGLALSWRTTMHDSVVVQCGDANGWRIFVPVRQAAPVAAAPVANAVNRGDAVAISISGDGFSVSQPGEALDAGAVGDWIRVRPVTGTRTRAEPMRGRIERPGVVSIPLP
ncbi:MULTISPECIES: flagella basal body P-ring formation protein FlgA [unclassified Novosphingobium]|uniref:flagella basal body P-ring formation protein FlgA n=1 Tax=unclassified Novosphingobium TaxID=2644732 RepID=UPI00031B6607|nr:MULTISPECIES: flagella basal body P-ring formation protein FlgA [unclassified Novosphingobium]GFM27752.1 uncharacterized protein PY1_contig-03-18 [Novosphingobium sp. PY1]